MLGKLSFVGVSRASLTALAATLANVSWGCGVQVSGEIGSKKIEIECKALETCMNNIILKSEKINLNGYIKIKNYISYYLISGILEDRPLLFDGIADYKLPIDSECKAVYPIQLSVISNQYQKDDLTIRPPLFIDAGNIVAKMVLK